MKIFSRFAQWTSYQAGRPHTFVAALLLILAWAVTGPMFGFSDTWQLIINTGTTIVTFLMVFLIQNTQNRDTQAIQLKLDELIRATQGAQNNLMALEDLSEDQLQKVKASFSRLARPGDERPGRLREARGNLDEARTEIEQARSTTTGVEAKASHPPPAGEREAGGG